MNFNIVTFGCKVNQYESNIMKESMLHYNFLYEENISNADIIIVNTCTVTNVADNKCLKEIRRIKREYPKAILVVTGCSSQNKQDLYKSMDIDILVGNKEKSKIGAIVKRYIETHEKFALFYNDRKLEFEDMFLNNYNHVRAFIKIEDGCDNFCSYCIIPYVRGSVRSKDFDTVISEAKSLVKNNHLEIVLTGIHTGRYESNGKNLADLLHELAKIKDLKRIRISSIEITELDDKFLEELKNNPKICNHMHIPLQSGSESILKRMNRKYDKAYFEEKINTIRSIRPGIAISTDIIVGHPYETESDFLECLEFAKKIGFSKIHVFPFSKREGTAAAKMPNEVSDVDKKRRVKKLIELSETLEKEYYLKTREEDVLIETVKDNKSFGHTSNYEYVEIPGTKKIGEIVSRIPTSL